MSLLFTYHQVIPAFLDFVLTFGRKERAQELHYGGFRYESRLASPAKSMKIPELGRSGRDVRLCYNLKSVELSPRQKDWPWSIRQTAIHHSFDIISGCASWIVVKGDGLMEKRTKEATEPAGCTDSSCFETNSRSFASSLCTHLIYIDWAVENWQQFLDYLEDQAQENSRRILSADVDRLPKSMMTTSTVESSPKMRQRSFSGLSSMLTEKSAVVTKTRIRSLANIREKLRRFRVRPEEQSTESQPGSSSDKVFCFADLQRAQYLEEKTNSAILVIDVNRSVIGEMKQFYRELLRADDFSDELRINCAEDVEKFLRRASSAENELTLQKSRAESLIRILADRKNLLFGVLEYHNMEASRLSAQSMHAVAEQTQRETVSMRIITLVTLFFLPATFISVSVSAEHVVLRIF